MKFCSKLLLSLAVGGPLPVALAQEYLPGIEWQEPPKVTPGEQDRQPPSDAIVLFGGSNLDAWKGADAWKVSDGVMTVGKGQITTKQKFGDCQLHLEWSSPDPPKGKGQQAGNSGVFLMGEYEVQVLDSYSTDTYYDGQAGAIYKQHPPQVNAMRKPGEWNTYDILWTCPRFDDDGELISPAYITVLHNGVVIQNHVAIQGGTYYHKPPAYDSKATRGAISLQDHGNPVKYRNIWVRELKPAEGKQTREPMVRKGGELIPYNESSINGSWELKQLRGESVKVDGKIPTLMVSEEGGVTGFAGVNRMAGRLSQEPAGGKLFGPLATTRMAGPADAMELEQQYLSALAEATSFSFVRKQLELRADGEVVLRFAPMQDDE